MAAWMGFDMWSRRCSHRESRKSVLSMTVIHRSLADPKAAIERATPFRRIFVEFCRILVDCGHDSVQLSWLANSSENRPTHAGDILFGESEANRFVRHFTFYELSARDSVKTLPEASRETSKVLARVFIAHRHPVLSRR